jgi:hypothetical protein
MALALVAPAALAQDATGTATGTATADGSLPPPKVVVKTVEAPTVPAAEEDPTSDHEKVVGHIGVGYLGFTNLKIAGAPGANGAVTAENIAAPVIGVRYWMNEKLGLDLGLGLGINSGSAESVNGGVTTTVDQPTQVGVVLHGGVPLVFAHQKHYKFLLVPELNVGFATATVKGAAGAGGANAPDTDLSGFHLDVGARIGTEIHFGFIGVPQLALQATVGVFVRHDSIKASTNVNGVSNSGTLSATSFGTSVQSDPWALFANNISAIYYMP